MGNSPGNPSLREPLPGPFSMESVVHRFHVWTPRYPYFVPTTNVVNFLLGYVTEETADLLSQDGCGNPDVTPNNNMITVGRKKRSHRNGNVLYRKFHLLKKISTFSHY